MNIEKLTNDFVSKWQGADLYDAGSTVSPGFRKFQNAFARLISKICESIDAELVECTKGHYSLDGFIKKNHADEYVYFSYSQLWKRSVPDLLNNRILVRRAKNTTDYRGGANHFCSLPDFREACERTLEEAYDPVH